jgi:hypothetical protein
MGSASTSINAIMASPPDYVANGVLDAVNWVIRNEPALKLT